MIGLSLALLGAARVVYVFLERIETRTARLGEVAEATAQMVSSFVNEHRRGIGSLAVAVEEIGGDPARMEQRLAEYHRRYPEMLTLIVTDAAGTIIASERQLSLGGGPLPQARGVSVADRPYFREVRARGLPYISDGFRGRGFGSDPVVAISAPWKTAAGAFGGVVEGSLDLSRLSEAKRIFKRLPRLLIAVTDRQRQLLWSGPVRLAEPLTRIGPTDGPPGRQLLGRAAVTGVGWEVTVRQPLRQIIGDATQEIWSTLALMVVAFLPSAVFAHRLARRTTRPLAELSSALDQVELGNPAPRAIPLPAGAPHELASIEQSTDRLLERLRASYDSLAKLLAEREASIEGEIRQRTHAERERDQLFLLSQDMLCIAGFDGSLQQINPAWERTLGWTHQELTERPYLDHVHPADLAPLLGELQRLRVGGTTIDFEMRLQTRDGTYRWLSWTAAAQPERERIYAVVRDVEARKKLDQMKDDFVSVVSHELRTPLTSIHGSLGLVLGGVAGEVPEKVRALIEIAAKNSERLVRLVNDILDIEKIESGTLVFRPARVELLPLVEQAAENNRAYAQQYDVEIRLSARAEAQVWADTDRLQQVLANLLSNAAKHSPRGGVIELGMTRTPGWVRIAVTDHGPGIPVEFQPRVFEKFAQADASSTRQKGGTGLGLSISKAIVERHGGRLWFETAPDNGTTFAFELPVPEG